MCLLQTWWTHMFYLQNQLDHKLKDFKDNLMLGYNAQIS